MSCSLRWAWLYRDGPGYEQVLVEMEGHGREDIDERLDVSRTVGWFTAQYPLSLTLTPRRIWQEPGSGQTAIAGRAATWSGIWTC